MGKHLEPVSDGDTASVSIDVVSDQDEALPQGIASIAPDAQTAYAI
jgi:hypothetical protein